MFKGVRLPDSLKGLAMKEKDLLTLLSFQLGSLLGVLIAIGEFLVDQIG